jgi:hypothetical protein
MRRLTGGLTVGLSAATRPDDGPAALGRTRAALRLEANAGAVKAKPTSTWGGVRFNVSLYLVSRFPGLGGQGWATIS